MIPKEVRKVLGDRQGDSLLFEINEDGARLRYVLSGSP
jgi:bifunctional DNA-binding transcriptional regulator/antitoxin component of YhaV-PrlF toxin-antitoxin module